jgi:serine/threonine protein phosphatase PrpC
MISLAMTRSIGDAAASKLGVTAEPDVFRVDIDDTILCIVLATDGLWDSLSPEKVVDIITSYPSDEAQNATEKLQTESLKGLEKRKIDDNTTNGVIYFDHE